MRIVFVVGLAAEQFIAGLSLLKLNFWYSTYVVYGDSAQLPNAANLGIIAAGVGVAVYAVVWVGLLILIKKDSPLNVLTRSWLRSSCSSPSRPRRCSLCCSADC